MSAHECKTDSRRRRIEPGIHERVNSDGTTSLELTVKINGRTRRRTLPPGTTLAQARKARTKMLGERDAGRSPLGTRDDPRLVDASCLAMAALRQRTKLTGKGRISETTVDSHEQRLRDHVHPTLGHRKLSTLRKRDVLNLIDESRGTGLAEWTCHHVLTALRTVLRHARENDLLVGDPFAGIPSERLPAQEAAGELRAFRGGDVNLLLARVTGTRDVAAATLLADTGLRASELCGLHWRDVSLTDGFISIEGQLAPRRRREAPRIVPTKSRAGVRRIPLTPRAMERLEALYIYESERGLGNDDDFVFTTRDGGPLDRHNLRRIIREAGYAAGVGHVTPQVLRRSVATAYAEADVPAHVAASVTGHSVVVYQAAYVKAHRDRKERENALERLMNHGYGAE
jgi:integrase